MPSQENYVVKLLVLLLLGRMEEDRIVYKILAGKPTGNKLLGRPRCRLEDNIGP